MVVHATEEGAEKRRAEVFIVWMFFLGIISMFYILWWLVIVVLIFRFCCLEFERLSLVGIASVMLSDYLEALIVEL